MNQLDAYEKLIREYLSKCDTCDECFAEIYCIQEHLKTGRTPQVTCNEKIKRYLRQLREPYTR